MKYCCYCGAALNDDAAFCVKCGAATSAQREPTPDTASETDYETYEKEYAQYLKDYEEYEKAYQKYEEEYKEYKEQQADLSHSLGFIDPTKKICIALLGIAACLWLFAPFFTISSYNFSAGDYVFSLLRNINKLDRVMSDDDGWLTLLDAIAMFIVVVCIAVGFVKLLCNDGRGVRKYSIIGIAGLVGPQLAFYYSIIKHDVKLSERVLRELYGFFGWGYWMLVAIFVAVIIISIKIDNEECYYEEDSKEI